MTLPPIIRGRDIGGARFPKSTQLATATAAAVPVVQPPNIVPREGAVEFIKAFSILVPGNTTQAMFTVDAAGNPTGGAAMLLAQNNKARISGFLMEGESPLGSPVLFFSIRTDPQGNQRWQPFDSIGLPARGGISSIGLEPFTVIPAGYFFGAFVQNTDGAAHYASVVMQGWMY